MLVEHSFITTIDQADALNKASMMLVELGFTPEMQSDARIVSFRRGALNARQTKKMHQSPQRVMVEFDRGRISFAATMEEVPQFRKHRRVLESCLVALATLLEKCLAGCVLGEVRGEWDAIHVEMARQDKSRRRLIIVVWSIIAVILIGVITLAVVVS